MSTRSILIGGIPPASAIALVAAQPLLHLTILGSFLMTSYFSQWLCDQGWTQTSFHFFSMQPVADNWQDSLVILVSTLFGQLVVEYYLVCLGWRILRGRLRIGQRHLIRAWVIAAISAPLICTTVITVVDATIMVVTRVGWVHLPTALTVLAIYFLVVPAGILRLQVRRRLVRLRPSCLRCAYNLTGNVSGICPECGTLTRRMTEGIPSL